MDDEIKIGSLVEIIETGVRLFVVKKSFDCDKTPLYCLCHDRDDIKQHKKGFINRNWIQGFPANSLKVIKLKI